MKTLITFLFITAFISIGNSQKIWITGPDDTENTPYVEVGDQVHFKAHFDAQGSGYIPVSYKWDSSFNFEHMHGASNIDGSTDGAMGYDPITRYSVSTRPTPSCLSRTAAFALPE